MILSPSSWIQLFQQCMDSVLSSPGSRRERQCGGGMIAFIPRRSPPSHMVYVGQLLWRNHSWPPNPHCGHADYGLPTQGGGLMWTEFAFMAVHVPGLTPLLQSPCCRKPDTKYHKYKKNVYLINLSLLMMQYSWGNYFVHYRHMKYHIISWLWYRNLLSVINGIPCVLRYKNLQYLLYRIILTYPKWLNTLPYSKVYVMLLPYS